MKMKNIDKELGKKYAIRRTFWKRVLGYCPTCDRYFRYPVTTYRRNTAYCEERDNWLTACEECHEEDFAYFKELWDVYNSSRL